jgi:hypothetical protein
MRCHVGDRSFQVAEPGPRVRHAMLCTLRQCNASGNFWPGELSRMEHTARNEATANSDPPPSFASAGLDSSCVGPSLKDVLRGDVEHSVISAAIL